MLKEKIIQELTDLSKTKGYLRTKDVAKYVNPNDDVFDEIVEALEAKDIDVVSEEEMVTYKVPKLELEDDADEQEVDKAVALNLDFAKQIEEELLHDKSFESINSIKVDDPVRMYLKEIGRVELLDPDYELALAKDIYYAQIAKDHYDQITEQNEDVTAEYKKEVETLMYKGELAKNKLVEANLRLVVSIAKRYVGRGMQFLDLIQEGNMGLIKAVSKFDHTKGFKFSTYATWWIRQAITRSIADQARTIRIPVHMIETINKLNRVSRQMLQEMGREATPEELAERMEMPEDKIRKVMKISKEPISMETPIGDDEDSHLGDFIEDEKVASPTESAAQESLTEATREILSTLTPREAKVLRMRFGIDMNTDHTLEEVGKQFDVTRERIRQIEAKALRKLRHPTRAELLRTYMDAE